MTDSPRQSVALILLFVVMWLLLAAATAMIVVPLKGNLFDFYPRWYGARQMLQGENPYSMDINQRILEQMDYDQFIPYKHNFLYPATITWILLPFWLVPFPVAISLWNGLQLLLLITLPLLVFMALDWHIRLPALALVVVSTIIYRHSMNGYLLGQFITFILGCIVVAWWQIGQNRPWAAALALIGATIRPEGALIAAAVLLDLVLTRRYKIVAIWTGIMGGLFALTVLQIGFWIPDFLDAVRGYRQCCTYLNPTGTIGVAALSKGVVVMTIVWGVWMLWQMRPLPDTMRLAWSLSVVILVYQLVLDQSKNYTLIYMLFPIWLIVWAGRDLWWNLPVMLLMLFSPWLYYYSISRMQGTFLSEELVNPLLVSGLLTYHWMRWKKHNTSE